MASEAKVALITGGASGMGLGTTEMLVKRGWNVTVVDYNPKTGNEAQERLGSQVLFIKANATIYDDLGKAFAQTWKKWGRIDLVYANAGTGERTSFYLPGEENEEGYPPKPDIHVLDICFLGVVYSAYLAMHFFRKNPNQAGKLVSTSSQAGLYISRGLPLYGASKAAVVSLTRSLAGKMKQLGQPVTVNCICPGLTPTAILPQALLDAFPADKVTPVANIVKVVENIVNDDSLTGQVIECSGPDIIYRDELPYGNDVSKAVNENWDSIATGLNIKDLDQQIMAMRMQMEELLAAK